MPYSESQLNDQTQHHWSVKLFDRPDGLADRNAHFAKHKARLAQFKKDNPGVIEFGGPMLDAQSHQPIGSVFVLKRSEAVPSFAAVEAWIEQDVYHENKIWMRRDISLFLAATNPWQSQQKE